MNSLQEIVMPDGVVIYARIGAAEPVDVPQGGDAGLGPGHAGGDVGLFSGGPLQLDNLGSTVRGVADSVYKSLEGLRPDKVAVEFGVELAFSSKGVVAVLASGGMKAAVKVSLEWSATDQG